MAQQADTTREIIVVTGMSGAGRTQAAKCLEDLGWFVMDNLPPTLLQKVIDLAGAGDKALSRIAVVADARGRSLADGLAAQLYALRDSAEGSVRVIFLSARDDVLERRYTEARRRHPMDTDGSGVAQGISAERELLADVRGLADLEIDTSDLTVHELRDVITGAVAGDDASALAITVQSFGFKHGSPRTADLVFDVRFLPNPHWDADLRPLTGADPAVRAFVLGHPTTEAFLTHLLPLLDVAVPGYVDEGKQYLTIAIGCTGGRHRSVAIAEHVAEHLRASTSLAVRVQHRDTPDIPVISS